MIKILILSILMCPVLSLAQSNKAEISISVNSVKPFVPLNNLYISDNYLDGGDYSNNSFASGIIGKYYLNETSVVRFQFVYTKRNVADYRDITTGAHSVDDYKFEQQLMEFSPGFQWTVNKENISFFGGLELPFTIIGDLTKSQNSFYESLDGSTSYNSNKITSLPGGISVGCGFFMGSNYFLTEKLALGFELGTAYEYTSVGGTISGTTTNSGSIGNSTEVDYTEETIKQFKFSEFQGSINLTFRI